jgi:hypothetical protein
MRIDRNDVPIKIDTPGAVARQKTDFGDATACGKMGGEHFSMNAGTDLEPLLKGLEGDLCQSPHWGYLIDGDITVTYSNGEEERVQTGDLFYWPPGHTIRAGTDSEFVLFSPQQEHSVVLNHVNRKLNS